jgi:hypothetical protein
MTIDPYRFEESTTEPEGGGEFPRLFLHEPGWRVLRKESSERTFCYLITPGQDHYHRIGAGELYVARGDEKICFACAQRFGLLSHEPRPLREPVEAIDIAADLAAEGPGFDLGPNR